MRSAAHLPAGALLLEFARFADARGSFAVPYEAVGAVAAGLPDRFVQDSVSRSSAAGTIRGLHLQLPPWEQGKLVRVVRGRIVDVYVDLRPGSPTRAEHHRVELGEDDDRVLWVPPGFGHGFCTVEPDTEVTYKVDRPYRPEAEITLAWDDPTLAVDWPVEPGSAVLSDKDRAGEPLAAVLAAIDVAATERAGGRPG